jgi:hypothetical protein
MIGMFWMSMNYVHAQEVNYSPEFVDTFMIQNTLPAYVEGLTGGLSQEKIFSEKTWDVQQVKTTPSTPSIVLLLPIILLIIIAIKFIFTGFFKSAFSGIVNLNVFQLHYRNKKFSEQFPVLLLFILRNIVIVLICQYLACLYFQQESLFNWKHFIIGFSVISIFYAVVYLMEYFVFNMIGIGEMFRVYFTQYFIITTWIWTPLILIILLLHINNIQLDTNITLLIFVIPILISAIIAVIRSVLLWNGMWRDNLIYFFMYLCTFKIIPYLILTKLLEKYWL